MFVFVCVHTQSAVRRGALAEYSVVYTDRVYNLMSADFQQCMKDISSSLKRAYSAEACVLVPGSGTFAMESVARAFVTGYCSAMNLVKDLFSHGVLLYFIAKRQ